MSALLAPDAALPKRDWLLDTKAVARWLAGTLGADGPLPVGPCELLRIHYRFGRRLRVLFRLRTGRGWVWVTGRAFPERQAEAAFHGAAAAATAACGRLRRVVHATDAAAVFWTFPNDRKLVSLKTLLREALAIARELGGPRGHARILAYKPETSLVLVLHELSGRATAYAKVYQEGLGEWARRIHGSLARQLGPDDPHLALAAPAQRAGSGQIVVLEAVEGRRIIDLADGEAVTGTARLGTALATFHTLAPPPEVPRFTRHEPPRLADAARLLARACPRVGRQAEALATELLRRFEPSAEPAVLFYCQHVLGMGHLVRSLALARALADRFRVVFLNGGPVPRGLPRPAGIEFVDLPPLGFDATDRLVSRDSHRPLEDAQRERRETILRTFHRLQPRAVVVELFPFGRRKFAAELLPLFEEAHAGGAHRPLLLSSLRDILTTGRRDQARCDEHACMLANRYLDAILVHGDPHFARLEESFGLERDLRVPVFYTGFVVADAPRRPDPRRRRRLIVSAGGGLAGGPR